MEKSMKIKIEVDTSELDLALEKVKELQKLLENINSETLHNDFYESKN